MQGKKQKPTVSTEQSAASNSTQQIVTEVKAAKPPQRRGRMRASEFSSQEKQDFQRVFSERLKPAISNWCNAYAGHVPFEANDVTADKFVERLGNTSAFYDYTFVVDGVTLTVADANGVARVDYLNAPRQTQQLMDLPKGVAPQTDLPVSRMQVSQMVHQDSGIKFESGDIRMIPSGVSSAMNGGAHVEVGGEPNDFLSWNYTLVFSPNGNLAYYCKGPDKR